MIRFIFKTIIFIILLCIGVSFFSSKPQSAEQNVVPSQSYQSSSGGAGSSTARVDHFFNNLQTFCDRNPHSCELSVAFFHAIEARVKDGAQIIMDRLGISK